MKDLKAELAVVHLLDAQNTNDTDTVSSILDVRGFGGALIVVNVGALTGVDGSNYLTPVLQESDTVVGTDFTTVAASDIHGAFTKMDATDEDQVSQVVGYHGRKRYIRVNLDFTGTGITAAYEAVLGILGFPNSYPAVGPAPITAS